MTTTPTTNRDAASEAVDAATADISSGLAEALAEVPASIAEDALEIRRMVGALIPSARGAFDAAQREATNLDIHPDGRRARAQAVYAQAEAGISELSQQIENRVRILEARLHVATVQETTDAARGSLARQDIAAILSMSQDKAAALTDLAGDNDPIIRGLIVGAWGQRYMKAAGITDAHKALINDAFYQVTSKGDDSRAQAARTLMKMGKVRANAGSAAGLAKQLLHATNRH